MGLLHEPIQTATTIEQRVLGVQMEVNEVCVRHRANLNGEEQEAQERAWESYSQKKAKSNRMDT